MKLTKYVIVFYPPISFYVVVQSSNNHRNAIYPPGTVSLTKLNRELFFRVSFIVLINMSSFDLKNVVLQFEIFRKHLREQRAQLCQTIKTTKTKCAGMTCCYIAWSPLFCQNRV